MLHAARTGGKPCCFLTFTTTSTLLELRPPKHTNAEIFQPTRQAGQLANLQTHNLGHRCCFSEFLWIYEFMKLWNWFSRKMKNTQTSNGGEGLESTLLSWILPWIRLLPQMDSHTRILWWSPENLGVLSESSKWGSRVLWLSTFCILICIKKKEKLIFGP